MNALDFSPNLIKSNTVPTAWKKVMERFEGKEELYNVIIHIKNPNKKLPIELKKFEENIIDWVKELRKSKLESKILPFTHGQRIYEWGGEIDQFDKYTLPLLRKYGHTKRAVIMLRDPRLDCKTTDEHTPAPQLIQFTIVKRKVHITAYYRSQEMHLFWIINIFELIDLQIMVCKCLKDIKAGSITTISFVAYSKPSDFPRISIEMLELSALSEDELEKLLSLALIEKKHDAINNLIQKFVVDMQKLERITLLKIRGFERLKRFIQIHRLEIIVPISKKFEVKVGELIDDLSVLDTYLKQEISSKVVKNKIKSCQCKIGELIDIVKMFLCPNVFFASVKHRLVDIRARIPVFLHDIVFTPIYFESEDFPFEYGHSHDVCLDAVGKCDLFLLIIGPRYGGKYSGSKYSEMKNLSITHAETRLAAKLNKPIYACVRQNIYDERKTYKDNIKKGIKIKTSFAESKEVFEFIDEIQQGWEDEHGNRVNSWIDTFNNIADLEIRVKGRLKKLFLSKDNER